MYFKSAIILSALYFVTVTQSIGIDGNQIKKIKNLYDNLVNEIEHLSKENMENMGSSIGMDNMLEFVYRENVSNDRKLLDFLLFVANYDKQDDILENRSISSYETRLYLGLFRDIDQMGNHDGLLGHADVKNVIEALDLKNWSTHRSNSRSLSERLLHSLKRPKINALEFLNRIWIAKPDGNGLDQKQVQVLIDFHNGNINNGHIDADAVTQFFKNLCIVKSDYRGQFAFGSKRRNSFLELQELLLVLTEYSNVEKTGTVYSTISVRYILSIFSKRDTDKDGLLNKDDVSNIASSYPRTLNQEKIDYYMLENDINNDNHLDIAEFFLTLFKENVNLSFFQ
ncbi:uncharacterized protein LOC126836158 isoform X2 [Adelges cooleyi]|uniref:uncharacterized protein LOC126836158 isoform X2 n=1 Tax=Adelges cooleyi TaxID=133065 RepID=UPI00217FA784|nr:uncharacterized protein LOC126836158 isoform X2 [Adelges cooleyi]